MSHPTPVAIAGSARQTEPSVLVQAVWIILFAALTAVGAYIEIPRYPVPYTLQTLFVLLAGALLGPRNGAISMVVYLAVGAAGAPVFASGGFGLAKILGPTGGYLLAFPAAAAVVGYLVRQHRSLVWVLGAMLAGLLTIFTSGTLQLYAVYTRDFASAFSGGFMIFSWWDLLKLSAAAMIYREVSKRWPIVP